MSAQRPILDPRTREDIMRLVARRAGEYVPEWRYERGVADPGAALAELFGDMFYETVDRYNAIPQKTYTEFLNLLGVQSPTVTPASGYLRLTAHPTVTEPVPVPGDTQVFAIGEDGKNVVFETERKIEATPASITGVFYADSEDELIQELDMSGEMPFFAPWSAENLQKHGFGFAQDDVLSVKGPGTIEVSLRQRTRFVEEETAKRLGDPAFAAWSWFDGKQKVPFDGVRAGGGSLFLKREGAAPARPGEDGRFWVFCDLNPDGGGDVVLDGVGLRSEPAVSLLADAVSENDIPISQTEGGYCFGRRPAPYGLFYIRSDCVFRKRGAAAGVRLDISPVIVCDVDTDPAYVFGKRIIDKNDAVTIEPEDVFVQEVVWEYYNGTGWARLEVSGNKNPFSCKDSGPQELSFTVPRDTRPAVVNAEEGYYIRARVVNVENYFSTIPRWILPFVRAVRCAYRYSDFEPAEAVTAQNNGRTVKMEGVSQVAALNLAAYAGMERLPRCMYLRFDMSAHAMPLSLLFEVLGDPLLESKILFEAWTSDGYERLRVTDGTRNLKHTGAVLLYLPRPMAETEVFGRRGFWLRMSLSSFSETGERAPRIGGLVTNAVSAVQRQKAPEQYFSSGVYDAGRRLELLYAPVLSCEVCVDEAGSLTDADVAELEKSLGKNVRVTRENNTVRHCWVRWERIENLALAAPEQRVFELDAFSGHIRFGNGPVGKVPPAGEQNIHVRYAYGGGARGNVPAGTVNAFVASIPRISVVTNITPMTGGTDRPLPQRIEALGNRRVKHLGRALGVSDFEEMVLENFQRAAHVKCFTGRNAAGETAPGHVCVAVSGEALDGERMAADLCQEIYRYLAPRCDCNLVRGGRLHVVPSTEVTISCEISVVIDDLDMAAVTQQAVADAVAALIEGVWQKREIGGQIAVDEIYQAVKGTENVSSVKQLLIQGSWYDRDRARCAALDGDEKLPFATVKNGGHTVRIS